MIYTLDDESEESEERENAGMQKSKDAEIEKSKVELEKWKNGKNK